MAGPKKERLPRKERRHRILEAATTIFSKKGFRGATTREIARHAGVSEAMVFRHFRSKGQLYSAILDLKARAIDPEALWQERGSDGGDEELLTSLATHYIDSMEKDPSLFRLLLYSALEGHRLSDVFVERQIRSHVRRLAGHIATRMEEGAFKRMDPVTAARAFIGMISHYLLVKEIFQIPGAFPVPKEEVVRSFVETFLNGLRQ